MSEIDELKRQLEITKGDVKTFRELNAANRSEKEILRSALEKLIDVASDAALALQHANCPRNAVTLAEANNAARKALKPRTLPTKEEAYRDALREIEQILRHKDYRGGVDYTTIAQIDKIACQTLATESMS